MKSFGDEGANEPRPRPFSPPPSVREITTTKVVLFAALAIAVIYGVYEWTLHHQAASPNSKPPAQTASTEPAPTTPEIAHPSPPAATGDARVVTKCVVNGKTSYGDEACSNGATATQLITKADYNLMAGLTPSQMSASRRIQGEAPSISTFVAGGNTVAANVGECKLIDAEIASLDAAARQPQSGQSQDRIRQTRKELRDRQFRMHC
jgi:hypothetical protein